MPYMTPEQTRRYRRLRRTGTVAMVVAIVDLLLFLPAILSYGGFSGWIWIASIVALGFLAIAGVALYQADVLTQPATGRHRVPEAEAPRVHLREPSGRSER